MSSGESNMIGISRRNFVPGVFLCVVTVLLASCGSAPPKTKPDFGIEYERFSAPLGEVLSVNIGDHIFVEGEVARVPVLVMSNGIQSTMPGSYGVPFSFSVNQTDLYLRFERGANQYFCASNSERSASFPGLGSVVSPNDCIGVRRSKSTGQLDWVVDNSIHNGMNTVWSRKVKPGDDVSFDERTMTVNDSRADMDVIYFQGFHSGLLHFEYHEFDDGDSRVQDFKFDFPPKEGDSVYGVRGKVFEVVDVDNTQLKYSWITIPKT